MASFDTNPFTYLSLIGAPAILTNASSVLALGTSNRFARAVDRARALSKELIDGKVDRSIQEFRQRQLDRVEKRSILLLNALTLFYTSLGSFAAASFISLIGAGLATVGSVLVYRITLILDIICGILGVGGLVIGCSILWQETRLAVANVKEESILVRARLRDAEQSQ